MVPVVKEDNLVCIFGDYKLTVNKEANIDKYPIPEAKDLLVKINVGRIFCKLDLSNTY